MVKNFKLDESVSSSLLRIPCSSQNVNNKYFFGLNRLSPFIFSNVHLVIVPRQCKAYIIAPQKWIQLLFDIFCYDSRTSNILSLWFMYIRPSRKQLYFLGGCLDWGSFGKLLFALCRLLEKAGKAVFTIVGQSVLTTRVSFVVLLLKI